MSENFEIYREKYFVINSKLNTFFLISLFLFCLFFVFATIDDFITKDRPIQVLLQNIVYGDLVDIGAHFFSLFDVILIIICIQILYLFGLRSHDVHFWARFFVVAAIIVYFLKMFNPNNTPGKPILGLPLLSDSWNYVFLLILFTFLLIHDDIFTVILNKLFRMLYVLFIIKALLVITLYHLGYGNTFFFNRPSVLLERENLIILGLFQALSLVFFLNTKKIKYLVFFVIFIYVQVFSFRRTNLYVALLCDLAVVLFYSVFKTNLKTRLVFSFLVIFFILITGVVAGMINKDSILYQRYFSMFTEKGRDNSGYSGDSGHFEQTTKTFKSMMELGFWGIGYGEKTVKLKGSYKGSYIHNVYAYFWTYYGVFQLLFFLFYSIIPVYYLSLLFRKKSTDFRFKILQFSCIVFLLTFNVSVAFITNEFVESPKMAFFLIAILGFLIKTNEDNYELFYFRQKDKL